MPEARPGNRRRDIIIFAAAVIVCVVVVAVWLRQHPYAAMIQRLRPGTSRNDVIAALGQPSGISTPLGDGLAYRRAGTDTELWITFNGFGGVISASYVVEAEGPTAEYTMFWRTKTAQYFLPSCEVGSRQSGCGPDGHVD